MKLSLQWLAVLGLLSLPILSLLPMGFLWLWEQHLLLIWLGIGAILATAGGLWGYFLRQRNIHALTDAPQVEPNRNWSQQGESAWKQVNFIADDLNPEKYPLNDRERLFELGKQVVETVAQHYHPHSDNSIWEIPFPYLLRIIELVSADLRTNFVANIPGSHIFTINDIFRGKRLTSLASKFYDIYRVLAIPVNPASALLREIQQLLTKKLFNAATDNIKLWLLQTYVKKLGYYAIELYSGTLVLDEDVLAAHITQPTQQDLRQVVQQEQQLQGEPLRFLILGQVKAGKSSLINALFGELKAPTDTIPCTTGMTPYLLERDGLERAIIFDSAGYEDQTPNLLRKMEPEILRADFILLVCRANQAARQPDFQVLHTVRTLFQQHPDIDMPPLLVVMTHIDQLRPWREWQPPYNIAEPQRLKEQMIRQAMAAIATDLTVDLSQIIPVNLKPEIYYNIEEGIIPAILNSLDQAKRSKYLRCVRSLKNEEYWQQLWKQTYNAGKVIWHYFTINDEKSENK